MRQVLYSSLRKIAAVAAAGAVLMSGAVQLALAQAEKKYKDQGEYDIYNEVTKDFTANNFSKMVTDLDTWTQKYAESDFKDDRTLLYLMAYNGAKQFAKAVDIGGQLLSRDLKTVYADP